MSSGGVRRTRWVHAPVNVSCYCDLCSSNCLLSLGSLQFTDGSRAFALLPTPVLRARELTFIDHLCMLDAALAMNTGFLRSYLHPPALLPSLEHMELLFIMLVSFRVGHQDSGRFNNPPGVIQLRDIHART